MFAVIDVRRIEALAIVAHSALREDGGGQMVIHHEALETAMALALCDGTVDVIANADGFERVQYFMEEEYVCRMLREVHAVVAQDTAAAAVAAVAAAVPQHQRRVMEALEAIVHELQRIVPDEAAPLEPTMLLYQFTQHMTAFHVWPRRSTRYRTCRWRACVCWRAGAYLDASARLRAAFNENVEHAPRLVYFLGRWMSRRLMRKGNHTAMAAMPLVDLAGIAEPDAEGWGEWPAVVRSPAAQDACRRQARRACRRAPHRSRADTLEHARCA